MHFHLKEDWVHFGWPLGWENGKRSNFLWSWGNQHLFSKNQWIYFLFNKYLFIFIYLPEPGLSCVMWCSVPWPGIEPGPPAWGMWNLSHWTTREVPSFYFILFFFNFCDFFFFFLILYFYFFLIYFFILPILFYF